MKATAWEHLLDGRFKARHPRRALWELFSDQRGRVWGAVLLFCIKQTPASLMPLVVGLIIDVLTRGGAFSRILWMRRPPRWTPNPSAWFRRRWCG